MASRNKVLSVVAAAAGWAPFPGTGHTRSAATAEPSREPQFLQACGGRAVPDLEAAVPGAGWPPGAAVPRRGLSQLDTAIGRRPRLNSKSVPSPLPSLLEPAKPRDGCRASAQGSPAWKPEAPEGSAVWEWNARLRSWLPKRQLSELAAAASLNFAN